MDTSSFSPTPGRGGLPFVRLHAHDGATADVYLHGAHVTAWTPAGASQSRLFLSDRAVFVDGKAIRGGVPVIFPQFSNAGPFVRHGFARTKTWTLDRAGRDADGSALAHLSLVDTAATRALWPHAFRLRLAVRVAGATLELRLVVENTGSAPFDATLALHTYLAADGLSTDGTPRVSGLRGLAYRDTTAGGAPRTETGDTVEVDGREIDRVYVGVSGALALADARHTLHVTQEGFADAVVWNPGWEKGAEIGDLGSGDASRFVCVEAAQVAQPVLLGPGETWTGVQRLVGVVKAHHQSRPPCAFR